MRTRISHVAGVLIGTALLLAACGSDQESPGGGASTTTAAQGNSDQDNCLIGTWQLDVQDAADQVVALMTIPGATAEASGTVTVVFDDALTVTHNNTLVLTLPLGAQPMVATAVYSGSASSSDWMAGEGKLTGSLPEDNVNVDVSVTAGGVSVPMQGFTMPPAGFYSGGGADVNYTCSGDSATISGPPPTPTWRLTRA